MIQSRWRIIKDDTGVSVRACVCAMRKFVAVQRSTQAWLKRSLAVCVLPSSSVLPLFCWSAFCSRQITELQQGLPVHLTGHDGSHAEVYPHCPVSLLFFSLYFPLNTPFPATIPLKLLRLVDCMIYFLVSCTIWPSVASSFFFCQRMVENMFAVRCTGARMLHTPQTQ